MTWDSARPFQAIAAAELLRPRRGIQRVLVVAPASVKYQWKPEIEKFSDLTALATLPPQAVESAMRVNELFTGERNTCRSRSSCFLARLARTRSNDFQQRLRKSSGIIFRPRQEGSGPGGRTISQMDLALASLLIRAHHETSGDLRAEIAGERPAFATRVSVLVC